jgi:hypothetical protein
MNPARDVLQHDEMSKEDLRIIIRKTYEVFDVNGAQREMRDALIEMTNTTPLLWVIQHFLREVQFRNWNLAIVFAEDPFLFRDCLESGDMTPYYNQHSQR